MTAFLQQAEVWTALAFFLVLFFSWRPVRDNILPHLDERAAAIARNIEEVKENYEEMQRSAREVREKMRVSDKEVEAILENGQIAAKEYHHRAMTDCDEAVVARKKAAENRIARMEIQAVEDIRRHLIDRCMDALEKRLADDFSPQRDHDLIGASLDRFSRPLH